MTTPAVFERYLAILDVERARPSLENLSRLVSAQLSRVPFENVSKLLLKKRTGATAIPGLEQHLGGIEHHNLGGTCYTTAPFFWRLLEHLGYEVDLCGADMSRPDVHVVSIVRLQGREYLIDVGYGAPFFEPMPRDLDHDFEIVWGHNRYVLHPRDSQGRSRMDFFHGGGLRHGYLAKPKPREIADFDDVIRQSYSDEATFMNVLVVERFFEGKSVRFHNFEMSESSAGQTTTTRLANRDDLIQTVEKHCGIPAEIIGEAIYSVDLEADIYS